MTFYKGKSIPINNFLTIFPRSNQKPGVETSQYQVYMGIMGKCTYVLHIQKIPVFVHFEIRKPWS